MVGWRILREAGRLESAKFLLLRPLQVCLETSGLDILGNMYTFDKYFLLEIQWTKNYSNVQAPATVRFSFTCYWAWSVILGRMVRIWKKMKIKIKCPFPLFHCHVQSCVSRDASEVGVKERAETVRNASEILLSGWYHLLPESLSFS